jgi:O-acetyl-ADP-ribose deacetylase (regulator of RNase III)
MIRSAKGDLLSADVEALVNTVNTVGVMGKGIALQFKQAFPNNFAAYKAACKHGGVKLGKMFVYSTETHCPRFIINFPTKQHWKGKSKISDIASGLEDLVELVKREKIRSIALPPLGCGHGGLNWDQVRPLIEEAFARVPEVEVELFEPVGALKQTKSKGRPALRDDRPR